jgi:hypothetical protein
VADEVSGVTAVIRYLQVEAHPLREPFSRCGDAPTRAVTDWSITQQEYYTRASVAMIMAAFCATALASARISIFMVSS